MHTLFSGRINSKNEVFYIFSDHLTLVTFNDRVAPDTLSFFTNYGLVI